MNYENEISELIKANLKAKTGIRSSKNLLTYYLAKYFILYPGSHKSWPYEATEEFIQFILSELGIRNLVYKGEKLNLGIYDENALGAVFYNYIFRLEVFENMDFRQFILTARNMKQKMQKRAHAKVVKYKKHAEYEYFKKYHQLEALNEHYEVVPKRNHLIEGFEVDISLSSPEHQLHHRIQLALKEKTKDILISERDLEDYLVKNLDCIEAGLVYMGRQKQLEHGVIDILARDKHGKIVILELKVEDDKDILWQEKYYTKEIYAQYKEIPRFIVVAPRIAPHITQYLNTLEIVKFDAVTSQGKIIDLTIIQESECKGA